VPVAFDHSCGDDDAVWSGGRQRPMRSCSGLNG
jgi:hypothetical protein